MQIASYPQYSSRWCVPCKTTTRLSILNGQKNPASMNSCLRTTTRPCDCCTAFERPTWNKWCIIGPEPPVDFSCANLQGGRSSAFAANGLSSPEPIFAQGAP